MIPTDAYLAERLFRSLRDLEAELGVKPEPATDCRCCWRFSGTKDVFVGAFDQLANRGTFDLAIFVTHDGFTGDRHKAGGWIWIIDTVTGWEFIASELRMQMESTHRPGYDVYTTAESRWAVDRIPLISHTVT